MIYIYDLDIPFAFEAETEEAAQCFKEAIELMGHEIKVFRK